MREDQPPGCEGRDTVSAPSPTAGLQRASLRRDVDGNPNLQSSMPQTHPRGWNEGHQGQTLAVGQAHGDWCPPRPGAARHHVSEAHLAWRRSLIGGSTSHMAQGSQDPTPNTPSSDPRKKQGSSRGKAHSVPSEAGNLRAFLHTEYKHGTHTAESNGQHGPRTICKST